MFEWFEKVWKEWFSLDGIELLDDAYLDVNRIHSDKEEE